MILSPKGEDKYKVKYIPKDFKRYDQGFFGRVKSEHILIEGECWKELEQQGYEIGYWKQGIPLVINNKYTNKKLKMPETFET